MLWGKGAMECGREWASVVEEVVVVGWDMAMAWGSPAANEERGQGEGGRERKERGQIPWQ